MSNVVAIPGPLDVVGFWRAAGPARWFRADPSFDMLVRMKLGRAHEAAAAGALDRWTGAPLPSLALTLLLDQAPRNMFRGDARAFASDAHARAVSAEARAAGFDRRVPRALRSFFYLPLMHSEDMGDQRLCVELYRAMGDADGERWAVVHADIIQRFGRFPHRNSMLGRRTTTEEKRFLDDGGFKG